jgi:hypothetical protein
MIERINRSEAHFVTVPAANTVVDINPEFREQLGLSEGDSSSLIQIFSSKEEAGVLYGAEQFHYRVGNIDRTFVTDKNGLRWEDIDVKSPGRLETNGRIQDVSVQLVGWERQAASRSRQAKIWGGNDLESAHHSFEYQRILEDLGVRTYKSLFVTRLNEWFYKGKKVPVSEIPVVQEHTPVPHLEDALPEEFVLAAEVRACRTKTRMQAVVDTMPTLSARRKTTLRAVDRARELVAEEQGLSTLSVEDYLDWFVFAHGRNIGRMHAGGLTHGFLHPGNITLDCRILDLDSMQTFEEAYEDDARKADREFNMIISKEESKRNRISEDSVIDNLHDFVVFVSDTYGIPKRQGVAPKFLDGYDEAQRRFPPEARTGAIAEGATTRRNW